MRYFVGGKFFIATISRINFNKHCDYLLIERHRAPVRKQDKKINRNIRVFVVKPTLQDNKNKYE